MERLVVSTWNIRHADKLVTALAAADPKVRRKAEVRRDAIREEIAGLGADVLCICEGPLGEERAVAFFADVAPDHRLITRGGDREAYGMKGNSRNGAQWIWFLIRDIPALSGQLQHLDRWRRYTAPAYGADAAPGGGWMVSYPEWVPAAGGAAGALNYRIPQAHGHWRHPQVLQLTIAHDGRQDFLELIGCHLKSKYDNDLRVEGDPADRDFFADYPQMVGILIETRVKLSTEAADIRHYIEARFAEDTGAAIVVLGDLNDGPGKERIERRFLYHDMVGALQGDVFFARQFLNHALFDAPDDERWTAYFEDATDPGRNPRQLLDHILFTQSMTTSAVERPFPYVGLKRAGRVEHELHHRIASARPRHAETSDHKPVTMVFERRKAAPAG